jgi:hypothetical protein
LRFFSLLAIAFVPASNFASSALITLGVATFTLIALAIYFFPFRLVVVGCIVAPTTDKWRVLFVKQILKSSVLFHLHQVGHALRLKGDYLLL